MDQANQEEQTQAFVMQFEAPPIVQVHMRERKNLV